MTAEPLSDGALLARLAAFDTTSHKSNREIADFISDYLDRSGVRITRHPTGDGAKLNLIVAAGPEDGDRGLVLSGHMDTVPAESEGWQSDPFTLTQRDGSYVARGSADMKGFLALAINRFAAADIPRLQHQLVLLFTHDEETGTLGARRLVDEPGGVPSLQSRRSRPQPSSASRPRSGSCACTRVTCDCSSRLPASPPTVACRISA
jgi:acetylornithine deacetylase